MYHTLVSQALHPAGVELADGCGHTAADGRPTAPSSLQLRCTHLQTAGRRGAYDEQGGSTSVVRSCGLGFECCDKAKSTWRLWLQVSAVDACRLSATQRMPRLLAAATYIGPHPYHTSPIKTHAAANKIK